MSTLVLFMMYVLAIIAMLALFLINFYSDPERKVSMGDNIVSPADGEVISILKTGKEKTIVKKGFFGKIETLAEDVAKECCVISIFMSPLDVHVNRSPIDGIVLSVKHTPGRYFVAFDLEKSLMNEKNEIIIKNGKIGKVKVIQIAGFLARRIICDAKKGDNIRKGQRIGKIVLGSQVTLILPSKKVKIKAKEGQKVVAGKTILAEY